MRRISLLLTSRLALAWARVSRGGLGGTLNSLLAAQNPNLSPDAIQQASSALLGLGLSGSFFNPTNFLTNRLFLQKMLQASFAINGTRNTVVLRVFNMTRQAFSPDSVDAGFGGGARSGTTQPHPAKRNQCFVELPAF